MTDPLSKRRLRLWLRLLRVTRFTEAQFREFLRVEHGSTLPRFDVMAALHRSNDDLTMTELSRMLLVSNGNTTTVVDRLEHDGLVTRTPSAADRRVVHVALTDEGGGTSSNWPSTTRPTSTRCSRACPRPISTPSKSSCNE